MVYTLTKDQVEKLSLPGRDAFVLSGPGKLDSKLMTFGITEVPPNSTMTPHMHEKEEEFFFILHGYGKANIGGVEEAIKEGTAMIAPPGKAHFLVNESSDVLRFTFCFAPPVKIGSYDKKDRQDGKAR